jgi:hypothetical protein
MDMIDTPKDESGLLARLAELELDRLTEYRTLISEQHVHAFRWLIASLLAVNGGLAITTLTNHLISRQLSPVPVSLFFLGVVAALLSAEFSQFSYDLFQKPVNEWIAYWAQVAHEKQRNLFLETELEAKMRASVTYSRRVGFCSWLSGIFFVVGCAFLAFGLWDNSKPDANCSSTAIEKRK